jgi:hypothetical protein
MKPTKDDEAGEYLAASDLCEEKGLKLAAECLRMQAWELEQAKERTMREALDDAERAVREMGRHASRSIILNAPEPQPLIQTSTPIAGTVMMIAQINDEQMGELTQRLDTILALLHKERPDK